jgi:hypothetical protein
VLVAIPCARPVRAVRTAELVVVQRGTAQIDTSVRHIGTIFRRNADTVYVTPRQTVLEHVAGVDPCQDQ